MQLWIEANKRTTVLTKENQINEQPALSQSKMKEISNLFFDLMSSREEASITTTSSVDGAIMCRVEDNTFNPSNKYLLCPGKRFVYQYNTTTIGSLMGASDPIQQKLYVRSTTLQTEEKVMMNKFIHRKENQDEFLISASYKPASDQVVIIKNVVTIS
jgi:hypothetical protein